MQASREPKTIVLKNRKSFLTRKNGSLSNTEQQQKKKGVISTTKKQQRLQQWGDEKVWGIPETRDTSGKSTRILHGGLRPTIRSFFPGQNSRPRTRVWFDTTGSPAHLLIRDVSGRDEGSYRCKVHFRHSPSWSQRITLTVKGMFLFFIVP